MSEENLLAFDSSFNLDPSLSLEKSEKEEGYTFFETAMENLIIFYNKSQGVPLKISNQIYINASNNNIFKSAPIGPIS